MRGCPCVRQRDLSLPGQVGVGGEDLARIGALSYRQVLADNSLLWFPGTGLPSPAPAGWSLPVTRVAIGEV